MKTVRHPVHLLAALGLALATCLPVTADPVPCDDPAFRVETSDTATYHMICAAASDAGASLATCGLVPLEPIDIETVDTIIHDIGQCLASYDCDQNRIRIIEPALLGDKLPEDDPYARLPDDVVFRALLTHELAHALVHQAAGDRRVAPVDHEYIANALELAAMPPEHRATLLAAAGLEPPISPQVIDLFIYGLAPRRFAAAAYLHFEEHGCATITAILDGTATFLVEH